MRCERPNMPRCSPLQLWCTFLLSPNPDMRLKLYIVFICRDVPCSNSSKVRIRWFLQNIDPHVQPHKWHIKARSSCNNILRIIHLRWWLLQNWLLPWMVIMRAKPSPVPNRTLRERPETLSTQYQRLSFWHPNLLQLHGYLCQKLNLMRFSCNCTYKSKQSLQE